MDSRASASAPASDSLSRRLDLFLRQLHTRPRQRLGQNFMTDAAALESIREAVHQMIHPVQGAQEVPASQAILEIGPGAGFLTEQLAGLGLPLTVVDADRRFCEALAARFSQGESAHRVRVIHSDILRWNPEEILPLGTAVAGNIPYNITSPILEWLMKRRELWSGVILTVQKEFAERLVAAAGTRACGPISIWMQLHADIRLVRIIGRGSFTPPPKVDSAVIRIDFLKSPRYAPGTGPVLEKTMRAAFQMRRKQMIHAVRGVAGSREEAERAFAATGLTPDRRPETLSLQNWIDLARVLHLREK